MNLADSSRKKNRDDQVLVRLVLLSALLCLANSSAVTHLASAHFAQTQSQSQTSSAKSGTAVLSGKVTINGKRAANIKVLLRGTEGSATTVPSRTVTTDAEGNYQFTNVFAGAYHLVPIAPALVPSNVSSSVGWAGPEGKSLILAERDTVQDVDFDLTRGGVITGRVTDTQGLPLIEEPMNITFAGENDKFRLGQPVLTHAYYTDDRGIYRIFGLRTGRYLVSVGRRQGGFFAGARRHVEYRQTFHPSVTDSAKATIIEVTEGGEVTNIDITVDLAPSSGTLSISGRVVDEKTGNPVANVGLGLKFKTFSLSSVDWGSNYAGEFKFQNLTPGSYSIYVDEQFNSEVRAAPLVVDIINQDVTGLVLKIRRSASISGVVVFENSEAKSYPPKTNKLELQTFVLTEGNEGGRSRSVSLNPDASFRVGGLSAGRAFFVIISNDGKGYRIMRVEREGMVQYRGMEIKDGEAITGVRLVARSGSGSVRGVVKAEGGELPMPPRLQVWISIPGEEGTNAFTAMSQPQLDSRGHFVFEKLPDGDYEVNASVFTPLGRVKTKQPVHISDGSVTEVTLTLKLNSAPIQ